MKSAQESWKVKRTKITTGIPVENSEEQHRTDRSISRKNLGQESRIKSIRKGTAEGMGIKKERRNKTTRQNVGINGRRKINGGSVKQVLSSSASSEKNSCARNRKRSRKNKNIQDSIRLSGRYDKALKYGQE